MCSAVVPQLKYLQFQVLCINCFILNMLSQPYPDHTDASFHLFQKERYIPLVKCLFMSRRPLRTLHISPIKLHFVNWAYKKVSYEIVSF